MGFEVPKRGIRLVFQDNDLDGAEVVCRSVSIEDWMSFPVLGGMSVVEAREHLLRFGDEVINHWNLQEDGKPIPATGEGLLSLPADIAVQIYNAWSANVTGITVPLEPPSNSSGTSEAASTPGPADASKSPKS